MTKMKKEKEKENKEGGDPPPTREMVGRLYTYIGTRREVIPSQGEGMDCPTH
jgi:hypothetical protein